MGFSRKRIGRDGKARYTAYYQDARGRVLSAGTYSSKDEADDKWQDAESKVREGRGTALVRGKQEFEEYVREKWFPNHRLELRGRENYTYYLDKRIIPFFRGMRLIEIMADDVREFVTHLEGGEVPASSIRYCLTILSAIFTTALNDQVVFFHPCRSVSGPTVAKKVRQIVTPEQYDVLHQALGDDQWRLLVETDIETGLRWGELTELRPRDFDFGSRCVTVSRAVVELSAKFHPDGDGRFVMKDYPKDEEHRVVSFSPQLAVKIQAFIRSGKLGDDDLLFFMPATAAAPKLREVPKQRKIPGTRYKHGTISAYSGYKCRCDDCKAAYAIYRADKRREAPADTPRCGSVVETDGHVSRRWFRDNVWIPARSAAKLGIGVKVHSLRHAHASWLLAGGADIARVRERLGHSSILTTQKYLHTLPDLENDAALDAFAKIRNRSKPSSSPAAEQGRGR